VLEEDHNTGSSFAVRKLLLNMTRKG